MKKKTKGGVGLKVRGAFRARGPGQLPNRESCEQDQSPTGEACGTEAGWPPSWCRHTLGFRAHYSSKIKTCSK